MLADREGYVDYYAQLVAKNRWKVLRLDFAPGLRMFMATHPDSVKMILRSGQVHDYWCKFCSGPKNAASFLRPSLPSLSVKAKSCILEFCSCDTELANCI